MNINAVRRFAELDQKRLELEREAKAAAKEADALEQLIIEDMAQNPEAWSLSKDGQPQMRVDINETNAVLSAKHAEHTAALAKIEAEMKRRKNGNTGMAPDLVLVHLNRTVWAKCVDEDWNRAVADLEDAGLSEFVERKYDSRKFSVYLRELDKEGKPLPEPLIGAVEADVRLSLRTRRS